MPQAQGRKQHCRARCLQRCLWMRVQALRCLRAALAAVQTLAWLQSLLQLRAQQQAKQL